MSKKQATMQNTILTAVATTLVAVSSASAAIVGFTENFTSDSANWRNSNGTQSLAWFANGGPSDSAFVRSTFNLSSTTVGGFPPTVIRAHASYPSSNAAYAGNWIAEGVTGVNFWFRHSLSEAVTLTGRFANPANSPGASTVSLTAILPNTWTLVAFDLREGSPDIISLGGSTYAGVFSNIGNMQFGFTVPAPLAGQNIDGQFDLASFQIVPAPGAIALLGLAGLAGRRRR